jgi:hypothetical protein
MYMHSTFAQCMFALPPGHQSACHALEAVLQLLLAQRLLACYKTRPAVDIQGQLLVQQQQQQRLEPCTGCLHQAF